MLKKVLWVIGVILLAIVGKLVGGEAFGFLGAVVGALSGAALGTYALKRSGAVAPDSALVTETPGVRIAKYAVLAIVLLVIGAIAYAGLRQ